MRRTSFAGWPCSIARTVDVLGDGWTLLVMREVFYGQTRFDEFIESLGIARNTLADRLRALVDAGLLIRSPYQSEPVRHDYLLTDKGRDLFGVLVALSSWGDRWLAEGQGAPVLIEHTPCGHDVHAEVVCGHCRLPVRVQDVTVRPGPGYPQKLLDQPAVRRRFTPTAPRPAVSVTPSG